MGGPSHGTCGLLPELWQPVSLERLRPGSAQASPPDVRAAQPKTAPQLRVGDILPSELFHKSRDFVFCHRGQAPRAFGVWEGREFGKRCPRRLEGELEMKEEDLSRVRCPEMKGKLEMKKEKETSNW